MSASKPITTNSAVPMQKAQTVSASTGTGTPKRSRDGGVAGSIF